MLKILIIDDEQFITTLLQRFFTKLNIDSDCCSTVKELDKQLEQSFDAYTLSFIDYHFYDRTAIEIVETIRKNNPNISCVVMSGDPARLEGLVEKKLACATLKKPFRLNDLQLILDDLDITTP